MKKGFVYLIGAGPGDPGLISVKAMNALEEADCIVYDYLANPVLIESFDCEKIYVGKKGSDHTLKQEDIGDLIVGKAKEGKVVARLKGGDPYIFGRGGEEAELIVEAGIPFCVVPGISSFYSAPAYAGIPLTHRDFSNAVEVITGHRRADATPGEDVNFPEYDSHRTYVFLMGVKNLPHIASSLVKDKNFPENTPIALISWGTRPEQRVVTGELSNIVEIVQKENIKPPSIIIVGGVVNLRKKLRWFDNLPLFGKKIVVTRTRKQASKLTRKLLTLGASVIEFPTIEINPLKDLSKLNDAVKRIKEFDWIYFTSQNAINIFFDEVYKSGLDVRILSDIKIAVIGPATRDELIHYGLKADLMPKEYVAESLLEETGSVDIKNKKILLPCSEDARYTLTEGLTKMGAHVDRIHTYRADKPEGIKKEKIEELKNADVITFTSSSTVTNFFSIVPEVNGQLASIGPVTGNTVKEFGYDPQIVAGEYTIDGLVNAIVKYYS